MALDNIAPPPVDGLPEPFGRWATQFYSFITDNPTFKGVTVQPNGFSIRGADGSTASAGAAITGFTFFGWNGTTQVTGSTVLMRATEAWSGAANGSRLQFRVVPIGATTVAEVVSLEGAGLFVTRSTAGLGYGTGAGGTVVQATSKATGVTLAKACGQVTMNNAALAAGAKVSFVVTSSAVAATDVPTVCVVSGGTANAYRASVTAVAAGSFTVTVENITAGSLSESPVIGFALIKAATS